MPLLVSRLQRVNNSMTMLNNISTWPALRWPWFLIAGSALTLELAALYFQYGMGLEPCVMCIYQRTAVTALIFAPIPALISPRSVVLRTLSLVLCLLAIIWGAQIAFEHVQMQNPENFMLLLSCDVIPNFPEWLQLHTLIPSIFEARGTCGDIDWSFLGLSMPQWMTVIFVVYLLAISVVYLIRLVKTKTI